MIHRLRPPFLLAGLPHSTAKREQRMENSSVSILPPSPASKTATPSEPEEEEDSLLHWGVRRGVRNDRGRVVARASTVL